MGQCFFARLDRETSGLVEVAALAATGSAVGHASGDIHGELAWVLFALIALHVGQRCRIGSSFCEALYVQLPNIPLRL